MTRFLPILALAASCGLSQCACAHALSETTPPPAKEPVVMATIEDNSTIGVEELVKRFLKLIESLNTRDDISVERFQQEIGLDLTKSPDGRLYGYGEKVPGGSSVSLNYRYETLSTKAGIDLSFSHGDERFFDMTSVCALDFDYYHNALKAMGFGDVPIYGEIGELRSWRYHNGAITMSIIPQNVFAGEAGRLCVSSIGTLN